MKKFLLVSAFCAAFFFVGCSVNDSIAKAIEKSYVVIVRGVDAVDYITEKIEGSELSEDIGDDLRVVRNALVGLKGTLVTIGSFVGAEIPIMYSFSTDDPILGLDIATEDLIRSTQQIE